MDNVHTFDALVDSIDKTRQRREIFRIFLMDWLTVSEVTRLKCGVIEYRNPNRFTSHSYRREGGELKYSRKYKKKELLKYKTDRTVSTLFDILNAAGYMKKKKVERTYEKSSNRDRYRIDIVKLLSDYYEADIRRKYFQEYETLSSSKNRIDPPMKELHESRKASILNNMEMVVKESMEDINYVLSLIFEESEKMKIPYTKFMREVLLSLYEPDKGFKSFVSDIIETLYVCTMRATHKRHDNYLSILDEVQQKNDDIIDSMSFKFAQISIVDNIAKILVAIESANLERQGKVIDDLKLDRYNKTPIHGFTLDKFPILLNSLMKSDETMGTKAAILTQLS